MLFVSGNFEVTFSLVDTLKSDSIYMHYVPFVSDWRCMSVNKSRRGGQSLYQVIIRGR